MGFADLPKGTGDFVAIPLDWAMAEFFLRNNKRVGLISDVMRTGYLVYETFAGYDRFDELEINALATVALIHGGWRDPGRGLFASVPLGKVQREPTFYANTPWWRRLFSSPPTYPSSVSIDILHEIPQLRQINATLAQRVGFGSISVYREPVSNGLNLSQLSSGTEAVTPRQQDSFTRIGLVTGGGLGDTPGTQIVSSLLSTAWDMAHQTGFTDQQYLAIAIAQRNHLVASGGDKRLIASWNAEIKQLLWVIKRTPF